MRAHTTITTMSRRSRQRRRRALALAIGVCALVIPSSASANLGSVSLPSDDSATNSADESGYSSPNSIVGPSTSEPAGSSGDSTYSSVNAITGAPTGTPTLASSPPSSSGDGFDWASALIGAGAAMALAALGGAALLTARRRGTVTPSPSAS